MNKLYIFSTLLVLLLITGCSTRGTRVYTSSDSPTSYSSSKNAYNSSVDKKL